MAETNISWKRWNMEEVLKYQLNPLRGLFFINCNNYYDVNDYVISPQFYFANFCCGGHSSVEHFLQKAIVKELFGLIKKYK